MATNEQGDLICVECSQLLTGRQKMYCSGKCRLAYNRTRTNAHTKTELPEVERARTRTEQNEIQLWQARYYKLLGQNDQLQEQVTQLQETNRQITAAALDKAKYEGAYMALIEERGETEQEVEMVQEDVVEVDKEKSADNDSIWKRFGRSIRKRF